jgi:hypothetical protein
MRRFLPRAAASAMIYSLSLLKAALQGLCKQTGVLQVNVTTQNTVTRR